ncbi:MAG: hypothetical protein R6V75_08740, partial [Bacteroidales bacterium]
YDPRGWDQQWGNTRAVRELGSAANQAGWTRRLSETWGGAGWQISFKELKRLVDWQVALGVNFVNPHLSYYSMQGVRKFDYPPSFSYQEPWWDNFALLGDYIGRICLAMSAGQQLNSTLILQPNTTAWMYHSATKNDRRIYELSKTFKFFIQKLETAQIEYDLGSEQVMKRFAQVGPKGLTIRQRTYDRVLLPPGMRNLDRSSLDLLESFLGKGYQVLCLSDSIDYIDGDLNPAVSELASRYPGQWIRHQASNPDAMRGEIQDPDIEILHVNPEQGQLFHQRRVLNDGQLLFVVNSDLETPARVSAAIPGRVVYEIDLLTGLPLECPFTRESGRVRFESEVPGAGSRLFLVTSRLPAGIMPGGQRGQVSETALEPAGPMKINRLGDNVLTIDYLDLETRSFKKQGIYFMNAMYDLFSFSGLPTGNPWQHKIQFRQQYLEMDHFGTDTWFKAQYRFRIDGSMTADQIEGLSAVIERPGLWTVKVNGIEVKPRDNAWWLDRHFPVFAIGDQVKVGDNIIELVAEKMSVFAELMPVYILGDFSLVSAPKGFTISAPQVLAPGSWKSFGLPFYSGQLAYQAQYQLDELKGSYLLKVGPWKGSVAEVWVNGEKTGLIAWDPMELDITDNLTVGDNLIELRITGTLKNTLGYHHVVQTGWIDSPWSWNQAPPQQPAGDAYQILDYGLMGGMQLTRTADR